MSGRVHAVCQVSLTETESFPARWYEGSCVRILKPSAGAQSYIRMNAWLMKIALINLDPCDIIK